MDVQQGLKTDMNEGVKSALLVQRQYFLFTIALDHPVKPGDDERGVG